ncbi:outer membrane beta-barrel protein [Nostoc ellipsosporum NOK]|nr:outer membrane beta-barrel protein [Nostoc ellipsosporum NOK]
MKPAKTFYRLLSVSALFITLSSNAQAQKPAAPDTIIAPAVDSSKTLGGVTVSSRKNFIEQAAGKITMNLAASPVAAGGNAYEALLRAPGMMEQQGNLQFRGRPVMVLIDGRPSNLTGEDLKNMLTSTPANGVEKVEILTNPPARYDAQGDVVINIKMARSKSLGTNGTLTAGAGAGHYGRYNAGLLLNHRTKKFNVYASYDLLQNSVYNTTGLWRKIDADTHITEKDFTVFQRMSHSYRAGIDYDLDKTSSAGLMIKGMLASRRRTSTNEVVKDAVYSDLDSSSRVFTSGRTLVNNISINAYYTKQLNKKGRELTLNADYFLYDKTWKDQISTIYRDEKGALYQPEYLLRNNSPSAITVRAVSGDYTHPVKEGRLTAGVKATANTTDNNAGWQFLDNDTWKNDVLRSNHFIYRENIYAAYTTLQKKIKKFSIEAGLRAEYTFTEGHSKTLGQRDQNRYFNLFPASSIQYELSDVQQLGISYRKKINRFGFEVMNPFTTYVSQYSYIQGNPLIRPSYSDNISLSHSYKNKLFSSLDYSHISDVLAPVFKKDPSSDVVISTQENLRSADQLSLSVSYMEQLLKGKWTMSNTGGVIYAGISDSDESGNKTITTGAFLNINNLFTFKKGWSVELSGNYFSAITIGVMHLKPQGSVNIGLSRSVMKNNGRLTFNVTDLFNTQLHRYTISSFGVTSSSRVKPETRAARLTFTWKFGNKQVKASKARKTGIEEEKQRTGSN